MDFTGATPLQIVTLVIAILGLVVSVIALTWQIVAWRLTGSIVKVELLAGALGRGAAVCGPMDSFRPDNLVREGFQAMVFVIRARNVGRIAVDVTHWSVATSKPDSWQYMLPGFQPNPSLPHRLEAGSSVDFYVPMREVFAAFYAASKVSRVQKRIEGCITLATGQERRSEAHRPPNVNFE